MDPTFGSFYGKAYDYVQQRLPLDSGPIIEDVLSLTDPNAVKDFFFYVYSTGNTNLIAQARRHLNSSFADVELLNLCHCLKDKRCICIKCGASLRDNNQARKHFDDQHAPEYECLREECDLKFSTKDKAKQHRTSDPRCRKYKCRPNYPITVDGLRCEYTNEPFTTWDKYATHCVELSLIRNCVEPAHLFHSLLRVESIHTWIKRLDENESRMEKNWINKSWTEDQMFNAIVQLSGAIRNGSGDIRPFLSWLYSLGTPKTPRGKNAGAKRSSRGPSQSGEMSAPLEFNRTRTGGLSPPPAEFCRRSSRQPSPRVNTWPPAQPEKRGPQAPQKRNHTDPGAMAGGYIPNENDMITCQDSNGQEQAFGWNPTSSPWGAAAGSEYHQPGSNSAWTNPQQGAPSIPSYTSSFALSPPSEPLRGPWYMEPEQIQIITQSSGGGDVSKHFGQYGQHFYEC